MEGRKVSSRQPPRGRRHLLLIAWLAPAIGLGLFFVIQGLVVGLRYTRVYGLMMTGIFFLGIAAIILVYYLLYRSSFLRVVFIWVNLGALVTCVVAMVIVSFHGFRLLLGVAAWGFVAGIGFHRGDFKRILNRIPLRGIPGWLRKRFPKQELKRLLAVGVIIALLGIHGTYLLYSPFWNLQQREFHVSDQQAQDTNLVLYYACGTPGEYSSRHDLIDVAWDYNVTLSMAWHVQYFNDTTPGTLGYEMANFSRAANAKGVKIEFFPFNWEYILEGGYFEAVGLTLDWYEYWTLFKNWTVRESITVDHILWDMEGGSSPSSIAHLEGGAWYLPTSRIIGLEQRRRELPLIRAEFERIIVETVAMGATTRITTWSPSDSLDGDHDRLLLMGQFGYVFEDLIQSGAIEYVSTMAYTNHWGDVHPDDAHGRQCVYECARQLRSLHPDEVGICIGNINGNGLTTIEQVVNEYYLAIAGGATCVRLFNGASWVNGWNYTVIGPVWGANGTRDLFEACQKGGTGRFVENLDRTLWQFQAEFLDDLILNLAKC
ncbi:MAG: hypothetical protein ACFFCS_19590 [Candidatus Hodarchaeota archaeon]